MPGLPHVIYVLPDEHYGGATGLAGDPNVRTPNLDRLALAQTREPYFDVLIQHGVGPAQPVLDVGPDKPGGIAPIWPDTVRKAES